MAAKIARQSATSRMSSPSEGASAGTSMKMTKMRLIIRAIRSPPTRSRMIAGGSAMIAAPKKPCAARIATSAAKLVASALASESRM